MKLNLGSGYSGNDALFIVTGRREHAADWKFVDVAEHYRTAAGTTPFECYDFSEGIREPDNSIEMVWLGDALEHVYKWATRRVLEECYRVLQPGGAILISVPDMYRAMTMWLHYDGDCPEAYDVIYGQQDERDRKNCGPDSHHSGFTQGSLTRLLASVGFVDLQRVGVHKTWFELAIQARKPGARE